MNNLSIDSNNSINQMRILRAHEIFWWKISLLKAIKKPRKYQHEIFNKTVNDIKEWFMEWRWDIAQYH
jgi:hypothetical protein